MERYSRNYFIKMTTLLITLPQAAAQIGAVSVSTLRREIRDGNLPCVKLRGLIRLRPVDVTDYIDRIAGQAIGDMTCKNNAEKNTQQKKSAVAGGIELMSCSLAKAKCVPSL